MPQGFGAVAAIERDDRATISESVPRSPDDKGNKLKRTVQVGGILYTLRTSGGRDCSPVTAGHREHDQVFTNRRTVAAHTPGTQSSAVPRRVRGRLRDALMSRRARTECADRNEREA